MPDQPDIRWAPRVRREKLRRLYDADARGIVDEPLLDDLGTTLYLRCRDILAVCDAAEGRVHCPRCDSEVARDGDLKDQVISCRCGWRIRWGSFQATYQHHELYARGAEQPISEFMRGWERARSPREKMLLIDRLIHAWHWESRQDRPIGRPLAVNLIEGSRRQAIEFLDALGTVPTR